MPVRFAACAVAVGVCLGAVRAEAGEVTRPEVFFAGSFGGTWASVLHPSFKADFAMPTYTLQAGVVLSSMFSVSVEADPYQHTLKRVRTSEFAVAPLGSVFETASSGVQCSNCSAPAAAGWITSTNASFFGLNARVDFSPLGRTGPYVAAVGGIAMLQGFPDDAAQSGTVGGSVGARLGFRWRAHKVVELIAEGGWQGQFYDGARLSAFTGSGMMRLFF
jgi:hypothetical protein